MFTAKNYESKSRTTLKPEKESTKNFKLKTKMLDTPTQLTKDDDKPKAEKSPVSSHNHQKETSLSSTKFTNNGDNLQTAKSLTSMELRKLNFPPLGSVLLENNTATLGIDGSSITDEKQIVGDVRFLLDFAILGHAKCATSFIM
jgi:hypothetical protein